MPRRMLVDGECRAVAAAASAQSPHPRQNQAFDGQALGTPHGVILIATSLQNPLQRYELNCVDGKPSIHPELGRKYPQTLPGQKY